YHSGRPNLARYKYLHWLQREVQVRIGSPPQELEDALSSAVAANPYLQALAFRIAQRPRVWGSAALASSSHLRPLLRSLSAIRTRVWTGLASVRAVAQGVRGYRGQQIDHYYVHNFVASNSRFVRGIVLEIGDRRYSTLF